MRLRQAALAAFLCAVMTLFAAPAAAQRGAGAGGARHVTLRLVAETPAPAAGGTVELALVAQPDRGWHGYWENPGDAGVATTLDWTLPAGAQPGPLRYPVPQRLLIAGLMNYVYEGPYAQLVTLRLPTGLAVGTPLPIRVQVAYLVCTREICVPERAELRTDLTVGDGATPADRRAAFDAWRQALPKPLGATAAFARQEGQLRLAVPFPADASADDAYFYPLTPSAIDYAAPQSVTRDGDQLIVAAKAGMAAPSELTGVLAAGGRGFVVRAVPGDVPTASGGGQWSTALWALLGAIAGGLLLNVMPCVFPILSLKALSLAKSGESAAHARAEAVAYAAGVIVICLALGALLLGLRAGGAAVGWAFQLTDPRVLVVLLLLTTGIALNLAGLFELQTPAAVNRLAAGGSVAGRSGAFLTGALAAIIATPCTGPFMGAALGTALVLPWWAGLAVFGGLGLGIALPFLAIGFVPALRRRLPRPGAWMVTLRRWLAVPMFATALALAWLVGRLAGVDAMGFALLVAVAVGLLLWTIGLRTARGKSALLLIGALTAIAVIGTATVGRLRAAPNHAAEEGAAEPFSEARLTTLRTTGKPVFVYFTADWCLTCKVNERVAIDTAATRAAFARGGVRTLVGDWTDGDATLGRFIERHNRAGVPLYLWYEPGVREPRVLAQVLTPNTLPALADAR